MPYANVDVILTGLFLQSLNFRNQLVLNAPAGLITGPFMGALEEFIEQIGSEMMKQAQ